MGFQENGNGEMGLSGIPLGAKNKYKRMTSELPDDNDDVFLHQQQVEERRSSTRKYVIACAIFASLNNVLLGYGKFEKSLDFLFSFVETVFSYLSLISLLHFSIDYSF